MSRARTGRPATGPEEQQRIAAFLRELAARAEEDATVAAAIGDALVRSGLLPPVKGTSRRATPASREPVQTLEVPDPFPIMRAQGEEGLRAALGALDVAALRQIVRRHRLDPARISARWTARDRITSLIVEQVTARLNHGKAFSRV